MKKTHFSNQWLENLARKLEDVRNYKMKSWDCKCNKCKAIKAKYKKYLKTKT